jgi:hypothetical protein
MIEPVSEEGQLNPWGITYPTGIQAAPGATTRFEQRNLTTWGMSHSGVYQWYQANVVPTLGTANPFVTEPLDAPIDANAYNLTADTGSFELQQPAYFSDLDPRRSASDFNAQIDWGDGSGTTSGLVIGIPATGYDVVALHTYFQTGTYQYTVTIVHPGGSRATVTGTVDVTPATKLTGSPAGQPPVLTVTQADNGQVLSQFAAFSPSSRGGVRVASADVNGDGTPDIIAATGPGSPAEVRVFDGKDRHILRDFFPFGRRYRGGLAVSAGNVDFDGKADIAVGNASGAVKVYSGADGSLLATATARRSSFRSGTGLGIADIDRDGLGDLVVNKPDGSARPLLRGSSLAVRQAAIRLKHLRNPRFAAEAATSSFLSGALAVQRRGRH